MYLAHAYFAMIMLCLGCSVTAHAAEAGIVLPKEGALVRAVPIETGAPANQHPQSVPAGALRQLLAAVRFTGSGGDSVVFSSDEIDTLATPLAAALTSARPDQDLVFATQGLHGKTGLFQGRTASAGRIFVRNGRLNLILGSVHYPAEQEAKILGWKRPLNFGGRAAALPGVRLAMARGLSAESVREDWLAVPLARTKTLGESPPSSCSIEVRQRDVEVRLDVLDALHRKGRIDETEFQLARREVLRLDRVGDCGPSAGSSESGDD